MHLIIRLIGLFVGVLFSALLYWWMWTETGVFAWFASLLAPFGTLGMRLTIPSVVLCWLACLVFAVPVATRMLAGLHPSNPKARDSADAGIVQGLLLVPILVLLVCLWGTLHGLFYRSTGEVRASELARTATWWPRNVKAEAVLWTMDGGLEPLSFQGTSTAARDIFLPVDMRLADNPKASRILIRTGSDTLKKYQGNLELQRDFIAGTLAYEPLPHRVRAEMKRRGWGSPIFAIVLQQNRAVAGYWAGALVLHLLPLVIWAVLRLFRIAPQSGKEAENSPDAAVEPIIKAADSKEPDLR